MAQHSADRPSADRRRPAQRSAQARPAQRGAATPRHSRPNGASPYDDPRYYNQRPPRRSHTGLYVAIALVLVAVVVGVVLFLTRCQAKPAEPAATTATTATTQQQPTSTAAPTTNVGGTQTPAATSATSATSPATPANADSWELTLVNKTHALPADWNVNVVQIRDSKYIDARIADALTQMVEDCAKAGYDDVFINEAYRSHERQQEIWDEFYNNYLAQGYSESEAYELTGQSVAVPGTSEHELGLAADICSINFDETYNAPIQTWLRENGWKYGFIQRYPAGKEDVTGTKNENWHFRYVGVEAAKAMHDSGQVLEEYLGVA